MVLRRLACEGSLLSMDSVILAKEALKLPAWERAQIIDALWRSLDPAEQTAIDQSWLMECRERIEAYRQGQLKPLDGEQALNEIESALRK
jgi:putative addiction module component (TIGR02574 family)